MRRAAPATALALTVLVLVTACTGSNDGPDPPPQQPSGTQRGQITVWSGAVSAPSPAATRRVVAGFTDATGIEVDLVRVAPERLQDVARRGADASPARPPARATETSTTATPTSTSAGLPDVLGGLSPATARALAARDLLDTEAADEVVSELGHGTFQETALELTSRDGEQVAVPSHVWSHLLIYRKDLFADANLPVPDTFAKIRAAAEELDTGGGAGIALPTAGDDTATTRTFERLALANRCQLRDGSGAVTLRSSNCVDTFDHYASLVSHAAGGQDADRARSAYLAGNAAIILAPSGMLDDLAGLDPAHEPTCGPCSGDAAYLARNSGVVTTLRGGNGRRPVQYGSVGSWAITASADTAAAQEFVSYMLDEGYLGWLGASPAGRYPLRAGTASEEDRFTTAWASLPGAAGDGVALSRLYPSTVLDLLRTGPDRFRSWAKQRNQDADQVLSSEEATLLTAVRGEHAVAKPLHELATGSLDPEGAARQSRENVRALLDRGGASPGTSPGEIPP